MASRSLALFELRLGASSFRWTVNLYQEFLLEKLLSFKKKNYWYKLTVHLNDDAPNLTGTELDLTCTNPPTALPTVGTPRCPYDIAYRRGDVWVSRL